MKTYYFPSLLLLSLLTLTACLEENESTNQVPFSLPTNPVEMTNATRVGAAELAENRFSMATIILTDEDGEELQLEMPTCLLSVLETDCEGNPECPSEIEEAGAVYTFGNSIQPDTSDDENNVIFFSRMPNTPTPSDIMEEWIAANVFPLIADAPLEVSKDDNNFFQLRCQDCPIDYSGQRFVKREIILTPTF